MDCPLQQYAPEGEPLHEVVEEFAQDQDAWLRDFLPALVAILLPPPLLEFLQGTVLVFTLNPVKLQKQDILVSTIDRD